jgi:hypothetical protein
MTSAFKDADHAHDNVTRHCISGIIVFVNNIPVLLLQSKCQGCIATNTYGAEFVSMGSIVDEAILIRYMLRCLGVPLTKPTDLYGENVGVTIQSAETPEDELKMRDTAVSYYHCVRQTITAKILIARWSH